MWEEAHPPKYQKSRQGASETKRLCHNRRYDYETYNELIQMIAKFLHGEYDAEQFSFDFPAALSNDYNAFREKNVELCDYLEEEMPEVCRHFDPYGTGNPDTLDEEHFRYRVMEIY